MSSPDTPSSIYPDRLIRPLPKRSLRSRLSQEAAESIPFPPSLPSTSLPAYHVYGEGSEYVSESKVHVQHNGDFHDIDHDHGCEHDHHLHHHHHHHHHDEDDEDDSAEDRSPLVVRRTSSYRSSPISPRISRNARHGTYAIKSNFPGPDGYEAFENTNNKKKRKIPTSGSLSLHSSLSTDLAHMGLGGSKEGSAVANEDGSGVGQYYGTGNPAVSASSVASSSGRGRYGRDIARRSIGRNPLGISTNGSNARPGNAVSDQSSSSALRVKGNFASTFPKSHLLTSLDDEVKSDQGIIAAAISNATALLRNPLGKGQENLGVLDQEPKQTPTNTQFTFTCESNSAKGVTFPEQSLYSPGYAQRSHVMPLPAPGNHQKFSTQGTQTSPNITAQNHQPIPAVTQGALQANPQGKKPRRRRGDVYALAARQRRLQQEYTNLHHPPASEDLWICEFCEYESIFGVAPQALIRQYEIKDRKDRRRLAEKRRLLEKAKLKGRKGKKQTRNAAKAANNTTQQPLNQQAYDQQPTDEMQGDEYLDDGFDDDPIPMPAPPLQAPLKTMPGAYDATMCKPSGGGELGKAAGGNEKQPKPLGLSGEV